MSRIRQSVSLVAVVGLLLFTGYARAGTVTGFNGVSLSIYANPFDPNEDFNASETTASFGDPTTGTQGAWLPAWPDGQVTHGVDRRDGRSVYNSTNSSSYIYRNDTSGAAAFMQFTAPSPFQVGTVITSQDTFFSGYLTPQPFTLQFNNGALGTTAAAWSAVSSYTSGPGALNQHPIVVTADYTPFTADTVRIAYSSTSQTSSYTAAGMQEVVVLPESLQQIHTSAGTSSGISDVGIVDNEGGPYVDNTSTTQNGVWYDISTPDPTNMHFTVNVLDPKPIAAMVLYGDDDSLGEAFDVFNDANVKIAHIAFDSVVPGEVMPIHFDTPVLTTSLRFQVTNAPIYSGDQSIGSIREVVLLATPEPASGALLAVAGMMSLGRRRRILAK